MSHDPSGKRSALEIIQEFSVPLLAGVLVSLIWANFDPKAYHHAIHWSPVGEGSHANLHFFANEILMVFFFGVAAKEITEACLPGGALNPPRKAINPLMGTLGGILGPIGFFFLFAWLLGAPQIYGGWGIPTATDIALAWLVARLVFGTRHPAVSFLLLLAVADDAVGLAIIAVFYPDPNNPVAPIWLGLVAAGILVAYLLQRQKVTSFWPYVLLAGGLSWYGLLSAHLHPALALVPVVPFMPNRGRDEGLFVERGRDYPDTLNQFEHFFKGPVDFGLFAFGLANAGVAFSSVGPATWAVAGALIVGKTVGITGFSLAAHIAGFSLPEGMNVKTLTLAGLVAGIGLTVALFVAGVAYTDETLIGSAKMGALISSLAAPLALVAGKVLSVNRIDSADAAAAVAASPASEELDLGGATPPRERS